jgi:TRAP-type C4-dicarboxylate transport system permease small subunit
MTDEPRKKPLAERLLEWFIALLMAGMVVLVFANVVLRYAFASGLRPSIELSRLGFVWITMLGSALALWSHEHLGVPEFAERYFPRAIPALWVVSRLVIIVLLVITVYGCLLQTRANWVDVSQLTGVPSGMFYLAGVVGGVIMIVIAAAQIFAPAPRDVRAQGHIE